MKLNACGIFIAAAILAAVVLAALYPAWRSSNHGFDSSWDCSPNALAAPVCVKKIQPPAK
jgi:hypothetical protein